MAQGKIYIGVGGWTFAPWRGSFYPQGLTQKRELEYMGETLTSVEVNGTFYGSQKSETFAKWHDETPEGFVFSLKGPRFATNRRVLAEAGESVERFITGGVTELKNKLGPINWQLAPTKKFDPEDFGAFLALLPKTHDGIALRHAVELRHDSFSTPDAIALLREHGVALVIAGDSKYPLIPEITADFVYLRLMGTSEDETLGYAEKAITTWTDRFKTWATGGAPSDLDTLATAPSKTPRDVFAYVISGAKERNPGAAQAMLKRL